MGFSPDAERSSLRGREPIHPCGSIQPHGVLLVLDEAGTIAQLAGDTRRTTGLAPDALLGQPIALLVDHEGVPLAGALSGRSMALAGHVARWRPGPPGEGTWDVTAQATRTGMIVEFEPAPVTRRGASECMAAFGRAAAALDSSRSLDELFETAAMQVRHMTGFERVLVYRFVEDDACIIVAQAHGEASPCVPDRQLAGAGSPRSCLHSRIHVIPDADYAPTSLQAAQDTAAAATPDMSGCSLRSASAEYLQHLKSMGAAASMTIPVIVGAEPWGLIACHHPVPRPVPYELRESCRHFGRLLSQQIEAREEAMRHRQSARLQQLHTAWLDGLRRRLDADQPIELDAADLSSLVPCDGMAIVSTTQVSRHGSAPELAELKALAGWLEEPLRQGAFVTRRLVRHLPSAVSYAAQASGVLAVATDAPDPVMLMWFRAGHAAPMARADDPNHGADDAPPPPRVHSPSRRTAREWTRAEVAAARELQHALTSIIQQRRLREMDERLQATLQEQQALVVQKNLLMQEVHHRVQNSLQIVNSMLQLQARQAGEAQVRSQFESAVNRLMAVSAVHRHLWRSSDAKNVLLGPYLKELCADLMRSWGDGWSGRVTVAAEDAVIPSHIAVTLALLITELLTNAAKYAYAGAPGPVAVQVIALEGGLQVVVADQGLGMREEVQGGGLGSKLIRIFTAQLGGRVETQTGAGGTTVTIVVPLAAAGAGDGGVSPASA